MSLREIWRYPVKSMLGEHLDTSLVASGGIVGDRSWAVRDEVRGGIRGAKKIAALMHIEATFIEQPTALSPSAPVAFTFPDATSATSSDADISQRLTDVLTHPVTLCPLMPASDLDHYRRGNPDSDDLLEELRSIFGRHEDEPLPDLSAMPPEIFEFESPPGTYHDAFPILLMTTGTLDSLASAAPHSRIDVRRFRPTFVIDDTAVINPTPTPGPWPEMSWVGRLLRIGTVVLRVETPCPRCVMITHPVAELPQDRSLMRTVVRDAGQNVGVYASVVEPGQVHVGDTVELLPT